MHPHRQNVFTIGFAISTKLTETTAVSLDSLLQNLTHTTRVQHRHGGASGSVGPADAVRMWLESHSWPAWSACNPGLPITSKIV
jgi:hypothetical protein